MPAEPDVPTLANEDRSGRPLDLAADFSLSPPEAGQICLTIQHPNADFAAVTISQLDSPLMPLWGWPLAIAWGLEPVTARIGEAADWRG